MDSTDTTLESGRIPAPGPATAFTDADIAAMMDRHAYPQEVRETIRRENLLPAGLLGRVHALYPEHSGLRRSGEALFTEERQFSGLDGFRAVVAVLERHGVFIGHIAERELFVEVYRFLATRHVLNAIDWSDFAQDALFQLTF